MVQAELDLKTSISPNSFSHRNRRTLLKELSKQNFDLIIIGGGITGAGIFLDATSRGLKVALFEKRDFASGTSSKSTKLIHGGLRYLKQFDFALVKEVGTERAIVHKLAPHLVIPEKMLLPLVENGSYSKLLTSLGLKTYDILARVKGDDKRRMLNKREAAELEPLLYEDRLKGAGYYAEYRTDDARLTIENIKTGLRFGGKAFNYTNVVDFNYDEGKINGVVIKDEISDEEFNVTAKNVVSAAGPWVDELRTVNNSLKGKRLHLTKGVHLVFPWEKLPVKQSVYFDIGDGRMMFAIPRGKITYAGTTDTNYSGDKGEVTTNLKDATYLLSAINNMFPTIDLKVEDIISSWAGLRPLIHEDGKSASELSRKDEIFISPNGLISIAGGKLTGYRKMAERVVDQVLGKNKAKYHNCSTDKIPLSGNGFENSAAVQAYISLIYTQNKNNGLSEYDAWYLVTNYGYQAELILEYFKNRKESYSATRLILSELQFCVNYEMVINPMDFFIRRTGRLYFDIDSVRQFLDAVLNEFKILFEVDDNQISIWKKEIQHELITHSSFKD